MKTTFLRKVFAVLMIVTLLASFMAVGASAAETTCTTSATRVALNTTSTATISCGGTTYTRANVAKAIREQYDISGITNTATYYWGTVSNASYHANAIVVTINDVDLKLYTQTALTKLTSDSGSTGSTIVNASGTIGGCAAGSDAEGKLCQKLKDTFGADSTIQFSTTETDTCKYSTSVNVDGSMVTVYLSQKPTTGDVGVQMGENGDLIIDGISSDDTSSWNQIFSRFKGVIVGITGVGTLVMIVLFIVQFMKLGASAGNPQARSQALTGVLWTGIAAALLGSVTIVVGFFYNAI